MNAIPALIVAGFFVWLLYDFNQESKRAIREHQDEDPTENFYD